MPNNKGKIFVIYHSPREVVYSDMYQPISTGSLKDSFSELFLRDDVGDNISQKNHKYNELTAIYWVYKHLNEFSDLEYVGFCHYRRFLCFNGKNKKAYVRKYVNFDYIYVDNEKLGDIFKQYDFIAPCPNHYRSVRKHYERSHNKTDINDLLKIIDELTPEYSVDAREYFNSKKEFLYNMFVFPKRTFIEYASFMFTLADAFADMKEEAPRLYISERITGIFIYHLIKNHKKPLYLPVLHIRRKYLWFALKNTIHNFKDGGHGASSLFMKTKPLILCLIPRHLEQLFRRMKARNL